MENHELNECLRKSRKLIQMTERDSWIPSSSFSGRTANTLKKQRRTQLTRLVTIQEKFKSMKC